MTLERNKFQGFVPQKKDRQEYQYQIPALTWRGRVETTFGVPTLEKLRENLKSGKILDLGSSTGSTTRELASIFGKDVQLVGLEMNWDILYGPASKRMAPIYESASQRKHHYLSEGNPPFHIQANGYFPPFSENSFDAVFMMNNLYMVLDHGGMNSDQLKIILGNIFNIIKPEGFLCIAGMGGVQHPYLIFKMDENKNIHLFDQQASDYMSICDTPIFLIDSVHDLNSNRG